MLKDKLNIDSCLKCSYCNTVCPVLKVCPDYPGPKKLGSDIERFRRESLSFGEDWVDYCLGCGQCSLICPNQVGVSEYIAEAKAHQKKRGIKKIRDYVLERPALLGKISTISAPVSNSVFKVASFFMPIGSITSKRKFPAYSSEPLRRSSVHRHDNDQRKQILFFPGCFINFNYPSLGNTAMNTLERAGYRVKIAQTGCCGLPATANKKESLTDAKNNILAMEDSVTSGSKVVTLCTSCGYTLKSKYVKLFSEDEKLSKLADIIATNTYDFGELMLDMLEEGKLKLPMDTTHRKLAYHTPCHLKAQGIGKPWFKILKSIPGLEVVDLDTGCCGMSGTYGFRQEKYDISMGIGEKLFTAINENKPDQVITECATCRIQIEHGTQYKALHPLEVFVQILSEVDTEGSFK